jgi:2-oxoisovalerate dehydrogenase E2 component (dihydrolipoyl transacylase)
MMTTHTVKMPDLGEGITEVEVVAWRVQVGDAVAEDQVLADVMTDKATVEIPSPVQGTVSRLGGEVGEVLAVGAPLIEIAVGGQVGDDGADTGTDNADDGKKKAAVTQAPAAAKAGNDRDPVKAPTSVSASPPSKAPAPHRAETPNPKTDIAAKGAARTTNIATESRANVALPSAILSAHGEKSIASPALRRRAWELGVELHQIHASGSGGRIMQADLDAHVAKHSAAGPQMAEPAFAALPARPGVDEQQEIKVIGLRRRIAQKMQDAKRRIPHFAYVEECDVTELGALRTQLNMRFGSSRGKLTLLPFLVRAMVLAAAEFPQVNALFNDETGVITRHSAVHLGIATQTDAGLMVPVLSHAQDGDLWANARAISRLADMARSGKATRDELTGSTITLTSLGALGGIVSTPIINAPEVAIVGVNRIVERPMVIGGAFVARKMMNLSSSFDHRVVDGQDAARFIQAVRGFLESPAALLVA